MARIVFDYLSPQGIDRKVRGVVVSAEIDPGMLEVRGLVQEYRESPDGGEPMLCAAVVHYSIRITTDQLQQILTLVLGPAQAQGAFVPSTINIVTG